MRKAIIALCVFIAGFFGGCAGGGSGGGGGAFQLIEFRESGKDNLARNTVLNLRFTQAVAAGQDLYERIKIQNVQAGDFSRAIGAYQISGDRVIFVPQYPELTDRSDAGLRANASYHLFLKSGADSLVAAQGASLVYQQEFLFSTNQFFEDSLPTQPPRAIGLVATDTTNGVTTDISRMDPRPAFLALLDNATLKGGMRVIDPGAGGLPGFSTNWQFDLFVSEPLDPLTVTTANVAMFEIRNGAFTAPPDTVGAGHFGTLVSFGVPITVSVIQRFTPAGLVVSIRVVPQQTLVDNARYRIVFSGAILGIDFRKTFIGENGLTGDGTTLVAGVPVTEVGGTGYTSEFLVRDQPPVLRKRTLEYDPEADAIKPENGSTTTNPALFNSALYDPAANPSRAVGFLSAFGDGRDGDFSVTGGATTTLDTGDVLNAVIGNPFMVADPDPTDTYPNSGLPTAGTRTFDSTKPTEWLFKNLTVSGSSTLRFIGRNPARIRVSNIAQIAGIVDGSGGTGLQAGGGNLAGGAGGPGGFAGGTAKTGLKVCTFSAGSCGSFDSYLNGCAQARAGFPFSQKGFGPGRGGNGGEVYACVGLSNAGGGPGAVTGTGGGGGGHATVGTRGEDLLNASGSPGSPGPACDSGTPCNWNVPTSGVIGVRSVGGAAYGDREMILIFVGGSGGGAGGGIHQYQFSNGNNARSGAAGGGGGGHVEIIVAGPLTISGVVTVAGGAGGKGTLERNTAVSTWDTVSGSAGGGAGGGLVLISGSDLNVAGATLDARGGAGGARPDNLPITCNACNAGGAGGKGFILVMDSDGSITGLLPGTPGNYDGFANGILSVRSFDASRFSSISAITELFNVGAANPAYQPLAAVDIVAIVGGTQRVRLFMSSARASAGAPLIPDSSTEIGGIQVALVSRMGGSVVVNLVPGAMSALHPMGTPNREAFLRVRAAFEYDVGVEAAVGPFAMMDRVVISILFN